MSFLTDAIRQINEPAVVKEENVQDEASKPLAVIVISAARYLSDPAIEPWVAPFYLDVQNLLIEAGYRVEYDPGAPWTCPPQAAAVWVGHDKGIKRFHRAPRSVKLVALETLAAYEDFPNKEMRRYNQMNYQLSFRDRQRLMALKVEQAA